MLIHDGENVMEMHARPETDPHMAVKAPEQEKAAWTAPALTRISIIETQLNASGADDGLSIDLIS